jgi:adenine phosphoribosyltransferase
MIEERLLASIETISDFPNPGIQFKDITPIFRDPQLSSDLVRTLADFWRAEKPDILVGIESRGFILGLSLAMELGVPFVLARKKGKLPGEVISFTYDLEYGTDTLEIKKDSIKSTDKVLIHDDILATGGTAKAVYNLVEMTNANVIGFSFIGAIEMLNGKAILPRESHYLLNL